MANKIILKKSSIAARVPTTDDLAYGELALNYTDGKLYYKKSDNSIQAINNSPDDIYILDDISGSFNGSTTSFAITVGTVSQTPALERLIISVGGVMQRPDGTGNAGFSVSGSNIVFAEAPKSGQTFFGYYIKQKTSADLTGATTNYATAQAVVFGF